MLAGFVAVDEITKVFLGKSKGLVNVGAVVVAP